VQLGPEESLVTSPGVLLGSTQRTFIRDQALSILQSRVI
jgi:hypothetical protein